MRFTQKLHGVALAIDAVHDSVAKHFSESLRHQVGEENSRTIFGEPAIDDLEKDRLLIGGSRLDADLIENQKV